MMDVAEMVNRASFYTDYLYEVSAVEGTLRPTVRVGHWFWGTIGFIEFDQLREDLYVITRQGRRYGPFEGSEFKGACEHLHDLFSWEIPA